MMLGVVVENPAYDDEPFRPAAVAFEYRKGDACFSLDSAIVVPAGANLDLPVIPTTPAPVVAPVVATPRVAAVAHSAASLFCGLPLAGQVARGRAFGHRLLDRGLHLARELGLLDAQRVKVENLGKRERGGRGGGHWRTGVGESPAPSSFALSPLSLFLTQDLGHAASNAARARAHSRGTSVGLPASGTGPCAVAHSTYASRAAQQA